MNTEIKNKIQALVQKQINAFHVTKARGYISTTDNGTEIQRIGTSVYLDNDEQVDAIAKVLAQLSVEGKAGNANPIVVDVFGTNFVVTGAQRSDYEEMVIDKKTGKERLVKNYSLRPKVILGDQMIGSNAEATQDDVVKSIVRLQSQREMSKTLKADPLMIKAKKELQAVSEEDFDAFLS
jgi:hypothetical protein